ncbi:MAG TPA: DEAD/DEAH box helicase [Gemmatimonas sp.]|nr:DEAD/DEAH box helicase [Gemmatimonas sp.]
MIRMNLDGAMHFVDLETARWVFGTSMLASSLSSVPAVLGTVTLLPHQQEAVARLRSALREFRGALLADDVGLGKTFVALAVATSYRTAHVIAPAGLLPMWRAAIERAGLQHVVLHSLHGCSRRAPNIALNTRTSGEPAGVLVIVDEAHHLRNARTRRYRAIADVVGGHDVLLLSATPVHNRSPELRAQLGLFLGGRADALDPQILERTIVRRTSAVVATSVRRPAVLELPAREFTYDGATLAAIVGLPAPLPAHGGAVAGALIRLGLLRAWCSSDAALTASLTRRQLRGSALRESLLAGRHPTNVELRTWLVGDQEVQLAFPELTVDAEVAPASLLAVLDAHLDALRALREHHHVTARGDEGRVEALRAIMTQESPRGVIAFSQFGSTIRALYRALSDIAGVGMLSASEARIASGRVTRGDLLRRFAPAAQGVPPPLPHQAIRLLLATDMLAEGVNLQDAGAVVHLDLPWTDALRQQRVGRVARIGSPHDTVHVHTFASPTEAERALRQLERLRDKASLAAQFVGDANGSRSAADDASAVRAMLRAWTRTVSVTARADDAHIVVACIPGTGGRRVSAGEPDALVLVQVGDEAVLLCGSDVLVGDAGALRRCMTRVDRACAGSTVPPASSSGAELEIRRVRQVEELVCVWRRARELAAVVGSAVETLSTAQLHALDRIQTIVAGAPAVRRASIVRVADDAIRMVSGSRGNGADVALASWVASSRSGVDSAWLHAWSAYPALVRAADVVDPEVGDVRLRAVILLGNEASC